MLSSGCDMTTVLVISCSCAQFPNKIKPPKSCYQSTLQQTALSGFSRSPGKNWTRVGVGMCWGCLGAVGVDKIKPCNDFQCIVNILSLCSGFSFTETKYLNHLQKQKLFWLTVLKVFVHSQLSPLLLGLGQAAQHSSISWQSKSWHSRDTKQKGKGPILDMIP